MLRLKNLLIKRVSFNLIPTRQRMIQLFRSYIALGKELANAGYNEYRENKAKIVYEECCVYHEPMDGNVLSLKKLSCDHLFHTNCIQQWFENLPSNLDLNSPMCRQRTLFDKVVDTYSTQDVENNNHNNNNL